MNWETINGVTGIISAGCALGSFIYMNKPTSPDDITLSNQRLILNKIMPFILISSGWALCCLSFLGIYEPYGAFVTNSEYQQFFGIMLSVPALLILKHGIALLKSNESNY